MLLYRLDYTKSTDTKTVFDWIETYENTADRYGPDPNRLVVAPAKASRMNLNSRVLPTDNGYCTVLNSYLDNDLKPATKDSFHFSVLEAINGNQSDFNRLTYPNGAGRANAAMLHVMGGQFVGKSLMGKFQVLLKFYLSFLTGEFLNFR